MVPSSEHSNVVSPSPVKVNTGCVLEVSAGGVPVSGGAVGAVLSTVHMLDTLGPGLPAASIWRTESVCWPSVRPDVLNGLVQVPQPPKSSLHWKPLPASPVNVAVTVPADVTPVGTPETAGGLLGGVVSTIQLAVETAPTLPAASTSRILTTWPPSLRPLSDSGLVQVVHVAPSIEHSNVEPASVAVNVSVAAFVEAGLIGVPVIVGAGDGAAVSTVQATEVAGPVLPALSIWRISSVCGPSARPVSAVGLLHATQAPVSSLHSNVAPGSPLMPMLAVVWLVGLAGGVEAVGAAGGVVSITTVVEVAAPALP